jgi:hypothetical protein
VNSLTEQDIRKHILRRYSAPMAQTMLRLRGEAKTGSRRAIIQLSDMLYYING